MCLCGQAKGGVIVKGASRYFRLAQVGALLANSHKANGTVNLGVVHCFEYICVLILYTMTSIRLNSMPSLNRMALM
jgi:hypothetical protein